MLMRETLKQLRRLCNSHILDDAERNAMKHEMTQFQLRYSYNNRSTYFDPVSFLHTHALTAFLFVSTVLLAAASEFSVPNDHLYGIKTNVNERLLLATARLIPTLHAKVDNVLLTRRLEEAEYLLLHREFKSEAADTLQVEISEYSESVHNYISSSVAAGEITDAEEARKNLNETLEKYDSILDIIEVRQNAPDTSMIDTFMEEATESYIYDELSTATSSVELQEISRKIMTQYANALLTDLQKLDFEIQQLIAARAFQPEKVLTERITAELAHANSERAFAEAELEQNNPELALIHLENALRSARSAVEYVRNSTQVNEVEILNEKAESNGDEKTDNDENQVTADKSDKKNEEDTIVDEQTDDKNKTQSIETENSE